MARRRPSLCFLDSISALTAFRSLSDKPGSRLHDELVRFHQTWYSANLMKGVLYGPQSLDELESLARGKLAVIPDRQAKIEVPAAPPFLVMKDWYSSGPG